MPHNWKTYKLGAVVTVKYGKDHKKLATGIYPCYGTGGVMRYVEKCLSDEESVLIPRKGSLNNIYYINEPFWTVDTLFWTKINNGLLFPRFLYYNLKTLDFASKDVGSAVPSLTTSLLNALEITIPPLPEQRAIASILSALDDKIELNLHMNKTLEEMAMALYKHWFVDFGPFQNGEFVESELGMIPEGWEVKRLDKLANFKNGKGIKQEHKNSEGQYCVYGSNGIVGRTNQIMFKNPVIAIGRVGANYGEIHYSKNPCWISDNAVTVQPIIEECFWWLLETLRLIDYSNFVAGSAQPLITQGAIKEVQVAVPSDNEILTFSNKLQPLFSQIQENLSETTTLTTLRDTILPKLISGEVRVKDIEQTIAAVL